MESINGWQNIGDSMTLENVLRWAEAIRSDDMIFARDLRMVKSDMIIFKCGKVYSLWKKEKRR